MDPVGELVNELRANPKRFRSTGGYERLLEVLREGRAPDALKEVLEEDSDVAGDLLWTIAELDVVDPFVAQARRHLSSSDKGTAAYAMEILLRGARRGSDLRAALDELRACDVAVCEHAVRTLSAEGLERLRAVLEGAGYAWTRALAARLQNHVPSEEIEGLVSAVSRDRQVVGLVLATLAWQSDAKMAPLLSISGEPWMRNYGEWLTQE